ncbi:hypothetical protein ASE07_06155 [Noviherbaspirillum sp. Root189]|nr:hypothetical protein ASE07_06155 [Noviherbaspirillum sp. Root189]
MYPLLLQDRHFMPGLGYNLGLMQFTASIPACLAVVQGEDIRTSTGLAPTSYHFRITDNLKQENEEPVSARNWDDFCRPFCTPLYIERGCTRTKRMGDSNNR